MVPSRGEAKKHLSYPELRLSGEYERTLSKALEILPLLQRISGLAGERGRGEEKWSTFWGGFGRENCLNAVEGGGS